MPYLIVIPYLVIEGLAFWAVASWLGGGWALLLLFAFFFLGLGLAGLEMRTIATRAAGNRERPGKAAGGIGLTAAGAVLVAAPGFVTTFLGLLLIFGPTRELIRRGLARRLRTFLEDMGARTFEATAHFGPRTSYGSFNDHEVIDEDEIAQFRQEPDDFDGSDGGDNGGDNKGTDGR
ncbi:FxsA family protein [Corynebacterium frankenforstense]|uniref:FxsA family protein n=1 Tax=Corynebacterium frankenforstense TaxID=1230998 RepID=UPI002551855B|nr:FxsA family protein [Corynebacterium frankenforstense]MDK6260055.1 FxsA family protein [Corynebacterium frankenforstense]